MACRLLLILICVLIVPLTAAADDDYTRKDYRESYERHYERAGQTPATSQAPASSSSGSYDEYSLYEWSKARNGDAPENIEPAADLGMLESIGSLRARRDGAQIEGLQNQQDNLQRQIEGQQFDARMREYDRAADERHQQHIDYLNSVATREPGPERRIIVVPRDSWTGHPMMKPAD